jgi:hypothetical protein
MLTYGNKASWLNTIWTALDGLPIFTAEDRKQCDNINTAMAWIAEELGVEQEDLE